MVLQVFQLFMWLWMLNFIIGLGQVTLAGAFASYYWAFNKRKDLSLCPVASSFYRSVRLVFSYSCETFQWLEARAYLRGSRGHAPQWRNATYQFIILHCYAGDLKRVYCPSSSFK